MPWERDNPPMAAGLRSETISAAFTSFRLDEWQPVVACCVCGDLSVQFIGDVTQRELIEEDA